MTSVRDIVSGIPPRTRPCLDITAGRLEMMMQNVHYSDGRPVYRDARDAVVSWSMLLSRSDRLLIGRVRIV